MLKNTFTTAFNAAGNKAGCKAPFHQHENTYMICEVQVLQICMHDIAVFDISNTPAEPHTMGKTYLCELLVLNKSLSVPGGIGSCRST